MPSGLPLPSIPDHELLRCIGRGAYGAVWLARNVMGTYRAVKIIHAEDFTRDRPFLREYEGLLKYEPVSRSHPSLMQVLHVGRREGCFYYVTELADDANAECERPRPQKHPTDQGAASVVHGSTLPGSAGGDAHTPPVRPPLEIDQDVPAAIPQSAIRNPQSYVPRTLHEDLERHRRLPVRECLRVAVALASALKHLHDHQLVHRDVKPSNVIFVHGVPKLADIGLVTTVGDSRSIVGTEGYLPPEGPGSAQADLYALGKLLYESSTGMNRRNYPSLPVNLREWPDAGELLEFNEVLLRACARDTDRRYHRADDLLADLALLERGASVKRLRRLERHHALLKRIGVGALGVALVVSAAWWQTWRAHRIANRQLAQLHQIEGSRQMAQGGYATALPWLVGALELEAGDAIRERMHRVRIAGALQRCPVPVAHFADPRSKVVTADLSPDGAVVATAHQDGWVRLWDTRSGKQIQPLPHKFPVSIGQFLPSGDRLLTVTMGQRALVWHWAKPNLAPLAFPQAQTGRADVYAVGLNESLGAAYLSKGRYVFPRLHAFAGGFENLTLSLKLVGKGDKLLVRHEVRRTAGDRAVLHAGEFLDTPEADALDAGTDSPVAPIWGPVIVILENGSWGDSPRDSGLVIWDNVRQRRYPTGERPPPWRMLNDFSSGSSSNWMQLAFKEEERTCQVTNDQLILSCARLPREQSPRGAVLFDEPVEISCTHTLEVEVDLISARAPHRMVSLTLGRYVFDPLSAPDRAFITHRRWLVSTWWDAPIRLFDLENSPGAGVNDPGQHAPWEMGPPGHVWDIDFSPDTNHVALVVEPITHKLSIWDLRTGLEVTTAAAKLKYVNGARFSPDSRFLAVGCADALELIRTADWQVAHTLAQGASFEHPRFAPRGHRLAAVRDAQDLMVWDLDNLPEPSATFPHPSVIHRVEFSPDGRYLATTAGDGTVRIWDVVREEPLGPPLPGALGRFNSEGTQLLLISSEGGAWLWDLSRLADDPLPVPLLRAGRLVAASADRTFTAEVTGQGITLKTPMGQHSLAHPVPVQRVAFTPGAEYLIAEGSDQLARVWDVATLTLAGPPKPMCYEAMLNTHPQPNLPVEQREPRILSALAALLGQQRPDGTGGMIPVPEAERARILSELQRAQPAELTPDDTHRWRWHRDQARAAELAMDWDAAGFHWEQTLKGRSEVRNPKSEHQVQGPVAAEASRPKLPIDQSGLTSAAADSKSRDATGSAQSTIRDPYSPNSLASRLDYARRAADAVREAIHRGRSRWSVILPRPPWATPEMLDLGSFYTQSLGEPLVAGQPGTSFRGLANGVQILSGTSFDVRGILHLERTNPVTIPVGRVCEHLHFLHAASQGPWNREIAATYCITYAGGAKAAVTLRNPEEIPPYTSHRFHEVWAPPRAEGEREVQSEPAWAGYTPGAARRKEVLCLTHTTWTLPEAHRGEVVESIELRAGPAQSAPLVFAITVE